MKSFSLHRGWSVVLALALILGSSGAATALESFSFDYNPGCTLYGVDPDDCFGGLYGITLEQTASGGAFDSYEVWMTVDTTGGLTFLDPGEQGTLVNLEFKVGSGKIVYSNLQVLGGSDGTWAFADGPLGGMGCGEANGDFVCMLETSSALNAIGDYAVGVSFDVAAGTNIEFHHLGVRFEDEQLNGNVVSIPIPEAGSPLLFAAGSLVVGVAQRRRAII